MAADQGEPRRGTIDPLVEAIADGVAAGYEAVDLVFEGLNETMRRRPGMRRAGASRGQSRKGQNRAATGSGTVIVDMAELAADVLERIGEVVRDVAGQVETRRPGARASECPTLDLKGAPGDTAEVDFRFTNTGSTALTGVKFEATDLVGPGDTIPARQVSFHPKGTDAAARLRPSGHTTVTVAVSVPDGQVAGTYRGVISTEADAPEGRAKNEGRPVGAWALLELKVTGSDQPAAA